MSPVRIILVTLFTINCIVLSVAMMDRPYLKDVCEPNPKAFDPKIVCHCQKMTNEDGSVSEFKSADCWLHGSDLREEDEAWDGFGRSANIKELSFVVFAEDNLKFLPQKGMYYLSDMTKFSLVHADIPLISSYAFSKLDKLEEISLIHNNISTIYDYAFLKLDNLRSLNLSFNQLTHIDRHVFYKNYKLESLHIHVNNITTIADKAFADLNNLIELRLEFNLLQRITSAMLMGLNSLVKLSLSCNYISSIDEDTFENTPALEYLDLVENDLQFIAANAFKWTPRLKHIDLEKNGLKHLDANLFRSMPNLHFLNVGKNLLNTFEVDRDRFMVERFLNESSVLFIHENNLVCDCRLLWLYELRNRTRSGAIQKHLDSLNCDLLEPGQEKSEQVFLLRLHYENFDCERTVVTTERPHHHPRVNYPGNVQSGGGLGIFKDSTLATSNWLRMLVVVVVVLLCNLYEEF